MSGPGGGEPIGRALGATAKAVNRAFTGELAAAGGSLPVWLVLLALKQGSFRTQQEIAAAAGIEGPTLTHHLDTLEKAGLIVRTRDTADRRVVRVELTPEGDALFERLKSSAIRFDRGLREGISAEELDAFRDVLGRLRANAERLRPR
jgi:MarR family transcriptional regulator, transcriptional regulator for hemolysin